MGKTTPTETMDAGLPKRTLRPRAPQQQPPPPGEPKKKRQRTEVVVQERQNPEETNLEAELAKEIELAQAPPSKRRRLLKVRHPQLTPSK